MPWQYRLHEWLADRVSWIQYPHIRDYNRKPPKPTYAQMSEKQRGWFWFRVFWGSVICLAIYGNLIR